MSPDAQRREAVLAAAVQEGRIFASGVPKWRLFYDSDPSGTEATLRELQPVAALVPDLAAPPDLGAVVEAGRALFPELNGRRGRGLARGGAFPPAPAAATADSTVAYPRPVQPAPVAVDTASLFPELAAGRETGRVTRADR